MSRTQIYLGEDELELLERASRDTGASRSELIRRAVRATFGAGRDREESLRALTESAGSHSGIDDADYLIAATALLLDAELLTTNVRHFPMLTGLEAAY